MRKKLALFWVLVVLLSQVSGFKVTRYFFGASCHTHPHHISKRSPLPLFFDDYVLPRHKTQASTVPVERHEFITELMTGLTSCGFNEHYELGAKSEHLMPEFVERKTAPNDEETGHRELRSTRLLSEYPELDARRMFFPDDLKRGTIDRTFIHPKDRFTISPSLAKSIKENLNKSWKKFEEVLIANVPQVKENSVPCKQINLPLHNLVPEQVKSNGANFIRFAVNIADQSISYIDISSDPDSDVLNAAPPSDAQPTLSYVVSKVMTGSGPEVRMVFETPFKSENLLPDEFRVERFTVPHSGPVELRFFKIAGSETYYDFGNPFYKQEMGREFAQAVAYKSNSRDEYFDIMKQEISKMQDAYKDLIEAQNQLNKELVKLQQRMYEQSYDLDPHPEYLDMKVSILLKNYLQTVRDLTLKRRNYQSRILARRRILGTKAPMSNFYWTTNMSKFPSGPVSDEERNWLRSMDTAPLYGPLTNEKIILALPTENGPPKNVTGH